MAISAIALASELLVADEDAIEELHVHEFFDDEAAHDDDAIDNLYAEFTAECKQVVSELSKKYGKPSREGNEDNEVVELNGVFCFAIWVVGGRQLYVAAAHEDRGVPILLMLGTAGSDAD